MAEEAVEGGIAARAQPDMILSVFGDDPQPALSFGRAVAQLALTLDPDADFERVESDIHRPPNP
jgi:hypothetical protein